jgi:hypothetical protein
MATQPTTTLTPATTRLALGRTTGTTGTTGTLDCLVNRAIFRRKDDGTFTVHVYQNGELIHHETRDIAGAQETLDCLTELGYTEVLQ